MGEVKYYDCVIVILKEKFYCNVTTQKPLGLSICVTTDCAQVVF